MKVITQIPYKGTDLQFLVEGKFVGYSFGFEGRNYGQKVEVQSTKKKDLVDATVLLTINAIQSLEALQNGENTSQPVA